MPDEKGRLTPHDLAFGIGRKATKEEWKGLFERTKNDKGVDIETARKRSKEKLEASRNKRKA